MKNQLPALLFAMLLMACGFQFNLYAQAPAKIWDFRFGEANGSLSLSLSNPVMGVILWADLRIQAFQVTRRKPRKVVTIIGW